MLRFWLKHLLEAGVFLLGTGLTEAQVNGLAMVSQHGDWVGSGNYFDAANSSYRFGADTPPASPWSRFIG